MNDTLLIHLGGLGDVCLSESTFLSLRHHCADGIAAVGNKRILDLFSGYFTEVHSVEERQWSYLFSDSVPGREWRRIILVGKDRNGEFRARLSCLAEEIVFIDMFPDDQPVHVEEYQVEQLRLYGIETVRKELPAAAGDTVMLYPERSISKRKWPVENFLKLHDLLQGRGFRVLLLKPPDLELSLTYAGASSFEGLSDTAHFLRSNRGLFVSNDSGLAHLAARCGLATLTLFSDTDPRIWHPLGAVVVDNKDGRPSVEEMAALIRSGTKDRAT